MANPSVTYTFSNGTAADASEVNTNFSDIINSLTDGTKSLSIDALTVAGAASFNGNVTLGNASGDDVTITGSIAADIVVKTDSTYDIGTSSSKHAEIHADTFKGNINFGNDDLDYYEEWEDSLSGEGNFTGGTVRIVRVGKLVTLSIDSANHSAMAQPATGSSFIPSQFLPPDNVESVFAEFGAYLIGCQVQTSGNLLLSYRDWTGAGYTSRTNTGGPEACLSWVID